MTPRVALPQSKLRARRRRRRARLTIFFSILFLLLAGVLVGLSWLPALRISGVVVQGAEVVLPADIESFAQKSLSGRYFFVIPKDNVLVYSASALRHGLLAEFPILKSVEVKTESFTAVRVTLVERRPIALWCGEDESSSASCLWLDADGVVYARAPEIAEGDIPTYFGPLSAIDGNDDKELPKQFLNTEQFVALGALEKALIAKRPDERIAEVVVDRKGDAYMHFKDGFTLMFVAKDDNKDVLERFSLATDAAPFAGKRLSDFEYLDLRFGDKLYYKVR